jgi:glycosyltransferase involved in cell wall biosynthesis
MRALHIGKFFPPFAGGMECFLADLLPALQRQGIAVAALVHDHLSPRQRVRAPKTSTAPQESFPLYRAPCYGRLLYAPVSPRFPWWLNNAIKHFKPDLLHLHLPNTSAFWALILPTARRLPWVVHWHADVVASRHNRGLALAYSGYRPLEQRLLAATSAVIATSPPYLESSSALAPWQNKCQVIPLGLDPLRLPDPSHEEKAAAWALWGEEETLRVLAVGRLSYYKGHEILLQAMAALPQGRLILVGTGEREKKLRRLINALRLEERVSLLGGCSEAQRNALLAACDVFCLPSIERTEAFGVVLLEAMHFAKPVIATRIVGSGVGWVVSDGKTGRLCQPEDPAALAQSLQEFAQNSHKRSMFGQAGKQHFQENFHIDRIAKKVAALYASILAKKVG